uniref:Retrotransposon gag domain-containing protein n=2 Tax=Brassica campestris TaxID=3711 RepID=M4EY69_BRACM
MKVSRDVSTYSIQSGASTMGFIEIPVFSGDDLRPWINWMENRFAVEDFTDDQKMALAYAVIRGETESWYNNRVSRRPFQNWKDLKDAMLLEVMRPSPSFVVTDSIPEADASNIEATDSCLVIDCDHDNDGNDHDDSGFVQEALHYEETILAEEEEVESKPEDRRQNKMSLAPKS